MEPKQDALSLKELKENTSTRQIEGFKKCSYPSLLRTCSGTALVIQASSHLNHYRQQADEYTWPTLIRERYILPDLAVAEQSKCSVHCVMSHCDWPQQKENTYEWGEGEEERSIPHTNTLTLPAPSNWPDIEKKNFTGEKYIHIVIFQPVR